MGTLVQGRVSKVSCKSHYMKAVPKEKWIRIENHHPFIIERRQFEKVQEIARKKNRSDSR
jgi:hypothetical protein